MFCNFVQLGIIVRDLDRTVKALSEIFGLGPFRFVTYPPAGRDDNQLTYRGQPGHFSHRIAFANLGPIELEIVEPLEGESGITEFLAQHGEGIHHIRFNVPDLEPVMAHLAGHDIGTLMSGAGIRPGTHWIHLDTGDKLGFCIEVMNVLPGTSGTTPLPDARA
jgi:catechol 2,3-dioxygenase-like lactoylglutathione lyase family enzyme